jgi:hypothetical protein
MDRAHVHDLPGQHGLADLPYSHQPEGRDDRKVVEMANRFPAIISAYVEKGNSIATCNEPDEQHH